MSALNVAHASLKVPKYKYVQHPSLSKKYPLPAHAKGHQEQFDENLSYKPNPDDLFIVSYPKCGSTWVQNILYLLRNNGVVLEKKALRDIVPFLEVYGLDSVEKASRPRMIKTHLYRCLIPFNDEAKYVFVARNPKDVVVSFYYHTKGFEMYNYKDGNFDDYFEIFIAGVCDSGDYFKLVPEWFRESQNRSNVHMILYEDMKSDIKGEILKLSDFLADGLRQKLLANNERLLNDVIRNSSFDKMQSTAETLCGYDRLKDMPFIRKGMIGDWMNHLSRDQSERIERKMLEADRRYPGFAKLWEKYDNLLKY